MTTVATDPSKTTCEVYWIRRSCHTDMFSEGYIGISTKGAAQRFIGHRCAANSDSDLPVHNAIRKYDDIVVSTILIGTLEYCLDIENKLRPNPRIGWNVAVGGEKTMLGYKMSEESKKKISENNGSKGRVYSEEEKARKSEIALAKNFKHSEETIEDLRQKALKRVAADGGNQIMKAYEAAAKTNRDKSPWENPNADKSVWLLACDVFQMFHEGEIQYRAAKKLEIPDYKLIVMYRRFKEGWNPNLCPKWQQFKSESPILNN